MVQDSGQVTGIHGLTAGQVATLLWILENTHHRAGGGFHLLYQAEGLVDTGEDLGEKCAPIFNCTDVANNHNGKGRKGISANQGDLNK